MIELTEGQVKLVMSLLGDFACFLEEDAQETELAALLENVNWAYDLLQEKVNEQETEG